MIAAHGENTEYAFFLSVLSAWIIFSCVAGAIARNYKGNSFTEAFLISLLLSPLIGIVVALVQKPNEVGIEKERLQTGASKKCPFCAEVIKKEARVCRYCGRDINQQSEMSGVTEQQIEELWRKSGIGKVSDSQTRSSSQRETQFYILQGSDITGPFDKEGLLELRKSGTIGDDDLVRREGVVKRFLGLFEKFFHVKRVGNLVY
jgi:hypothetical protein